MFSCFSAFAMKNNLSNVYIAVILGVSNLSLQLNAMLNAELTPDDITCLEDFAFLRLKMVRDLGYREDDLPAYRLIGVEEIGTHGKPTLRKTHGFYCYLRRNANPCVVQSC